MEGKVSVQDVNTAIRSAKATGQVSSKMGKFGTLQTHYTGTNGITVILGHLSGPAFYCGFLPARDARLVGSRGSPAQQESATFKQRFELGDEMIDTRRLILSVRTCECASGSDVN